MTSISDFNGAEKLNLFVVALIGFIAGYFFAPQHMDKASRTKGYIFEIVGALIGFGLAYLWINSRHTSSH